MSGGTTYDELIPLLSVRCPTLKRERVTRSRDLIERLSLRIKTIQSRRLRSTWRNNRWDLLGTVFYDGFLFRRDILVLRLVVCDHSILNRDRCGIAQRYVAAISERANISGNPLEERPSRSPSESVALS